MAEQRYLLAAGRLLRREERSASDRIEAEQLKEIGRHVRSADLLQVIPYSQCEARAPEERQTRKDLVLRSPVAKIGVTDALRYRSFCFIKVSHQHQLFRRAIWQWLEQHRVHHAENRSVRADAQRQRENSNQREAGFLHQHSRAIAQVLP